jgi:uncharacterized protein (DUF302 family)
MNMTQDQDHPVTRRAVFVSGAVICLWGGVQAMAAEGLTTVKSGYDPKETMDRLEADVRAKGVTVFARIDPTAGATAVGLTLRPTELMIFGNARGGTPLMQAAQTIGIDLPLKALVWQDASGDTWLSYNDHKCPDRRARLPGESCNHIAIGKRGVP